MKTRLVPVFVVAGAALVAACKSNPPSATPVESGRPANTATTTSSGEHAVTSTAGAAVTTTSGSHAAAVPQDPYPTAPAIKVKVTAKGFVPAEIRGKKDTPMAIEFTRTEAKTCATEAVFPWLGDLTVDLPLNEPVRVSFKPPKTGDLKFACGMHMVVGKIVVAEK